MTINRRNFGKAIGAGAAGTAAASLVGWARPSSASASGVTPVASVTRGTHTSFGSLKQVDAGLLSIGYAEAGPADGPVVMLLHGFPYDIHSYVDVAPLLAQQGYRVIVPYLRGHGPTRFRSARTFRNAQQSAFALDVIALMDALKIREAVFGGFDWGSRTADIIAALWPERCKALVSVSGYLVTNREVQKQPLLPSAEHVWWYEFYFATPRGEAGLSANTSAFAKLTWQLVSPTWDFDDATFERTAAAFTNPDWVPIVIHNYRWRLSLADGERRYDKLEQQLAGAPKISVPTIAIDAELDPFAPGASDTAYRPQFTGAYEHRVLKGIGHDVPQEDPQAFAQAIIDVDGG